MFVGQGSLVTIKTPLSLTQSSSYFPYMPPMSSGGWPSAYGAIYRQQLWVYTLVSKLAKATARLPMPVTTATTRTGPATTSTRWRSCSLGQTPA